MQDPFEGLASIEIRRASLDFRASIKGDGPYLTPYLLQKCFGYFSLQHRWESKKLATSLLLVSPSNLPYKALDNKNSISGMHHTLLNINGSEPTQNDRRTFSVITF